eukprot:4295785-Amphidinium_carterae.1
MRVSPPVSVHLVEKECDEESEEVDALIGHWSQVFDRQDSSEVRSGLLEYVAPLPWSDITVDREDILNALHQAKHSGPGPDGCGYLHLQGLADEVVTVIELHQREWAASLPSAPQFQDSLIAFLPKVTKPSCSPAEFRPISLKNCIAKLVPAALAHSMGKKFPCLLHFARYGAQKGRTIADAFAFLEKAAFTLSASPMACLLFCDLRTAFPTLRRGWLWRVLQASGISDGMLTVVEYILAPMTAWVSWRKRHWPGFTLWSGLLQGDPASSMFFVIALDPWVRYCCYRMPRPVFVHYPLVLFLDDGTVM